MRDRSIPNHARAVSVTFSQDSETFMVIESSLLGPKWGWGNVGIITGWIRRSWGPHSGRAALLMKQWHCPQPGLPFLESQDQKKSHNCLRNAFVYFYVTS